MTFSLPADLTAQYVRRVAERDNPPPPPSPEPAAVQARIEAWLRTGYGVRDPRGRLRLGRMLLALMQHPERTTGQLGEAAGLPARAAARAAVRLGNLGLTTWEYRSYWRYWRLTRATEDALLVVVAGPSGVVRAVTSPPGPLSKKEGEPDD